MGLDKRTARRDRASIQQRQGTARHSLNFVLSAAAVAHVHPSCHNIPMVYIARAYCFFVYFASAMSHWIFLCPIAFVILTRLSSQPGFTYCSLAAAELDRVISTSRTSNVMPISPVNSTDQTREAVRKIKHNALKRLSSFKKQTLDNMMAKKCSKMSLPSRYRWQMY
jgi:hypothetical protein